MSMDTVIKLVLVVGIVLIVFAIGVRARIENPLLLVRRPALALRAMVAMFVLLPLFALMVTRLLPLQQGVGAALLGVAVSPMLPPWAKMGSKVGAKGDYVFGLQVLATAFSIFVVPVMLWLVTATASRHPGIALLLASEVFPDSERAILGTVLLYLIASIAITLPHQRWRVKMLAIADVSAVDPRRRYGGP